MTVRRWAWSNSAAPAGIFEIDDADIALVHSTFGEWAYSLYPGTELTVVGSGGNLSGFPMTDTRYQAGTYTTRVDRFSTEAETPNINVVTVNYSRITQSIYSGGIPADTNNLRWPLYFDASYNLRAMSTTDFYDTFVAPTLAAATGSTGGEYFISTATSVAGAALVSATPVFTDTRANTGAYTAGGIPETTDQPTTINNYYLHRTAPVATPGDTGTLPIY